MPYNSKSPSNPGSEATLQSGKLAYATRRAGQAASDKGSSLGHARAAHAVTSAAEQTVARMPKEFQPRNAARVPWPRLRGHVEYGLAPEELLLPRRQNKIVHR